MSDISAQRPAQGQWLGLVLFLALTLSIGFVSGFATMPGVAGWFQTIHKPSFNPPNWIFAPVWTTLYVFMAVAAWRVWRVTGLSHRAMTLFFVQLALIALTTVAFARIDTFAGVLFLPYLAWVGFATVLNFAILRLNG